MEERKMAARKCTKSKSERLYEAAEAAFAKAQEAKKAEAQAWESSRTEGWAAMEETAKANIAWARAAAASEKCKRKKR